MHGNVLEVLGSGLALLAFHWNFTVVASEPCSKCSLTQRIDNFNIEIVSQKERKEGQEKGSIKGMKRIMICHPGQLQCLGGRFLFKYCLDYMMKLGQVTRATSKHRGLNYNQIVLQISSAQNDKISNKI